MSKFKPANVQLSIFCLKDRNTSFSRQTVYKGIKINIIIRPFILFVTMGDLTTILKKEPTSTLFSLVLEMTIKNCSLKLFFQNEHQRIAYANDSTIIVKKQKKLKRFICKRSKEIQIRNELE